MLHDLQSFIALLRREGELAEIKTEVSPHLEAAEIHRRVIAEGGPALLFTNIRGARFPLVTNLFGTQRRIELAFGTRPERLVAEAAKLPEELLPPSLTRLWSKRHIIADLLRVGLSTKSSAPVTEYSVAPRLSELPLLTTWEKDGGAFITLPLVYTQHPVNQGHNLGMYRIQRFDDRTTGLHCQIGKGGGFHLAEAAALGRKLPVSIHIGGPPALILSAIAPLPENVPELLLASLVQGQRITLANPPGSPLPVIGNAEFALVGEVDPTERRPEGPFGDHYGYYSLQHDYPVFHCQRVFHRRNAICAATVVGKPKQEDFFLGDYLQSLLSPLFPLVMPSVSDLWSYGETGYHSLAAAVVKQRYQRESMVSAFRILGEGQLALTKFLLVIDRPCDLKNFRQVLTHVLERVDFRSDLYVFSNLAMDTLDYTGPKVNQGSKGVMLGVGDPIRSLPSDWKGELPPGMKHAVAFSPGCLVLDGLSYGDEPLLGEVLVKMPCFKNWPLLVLVDDAREASASVSNFLWTAFTRFEPAADIKARDKLIVRNHIAFDSPILIDARMKPWYPEELVCDPATGSLVSARWHEYGLSKAR
ncbi:MAG: UbiD family decarboxylase [Oligoflexia bacterium]|nr:UbiD family decarboxylase [Oligoflexia bacterium]